MKWISTLCMAAVVAACATTPEGSSKEPPQKTEPTDPEPRDPTKPDARVAMGAVIVALGPT